MSSTVRYISSPSGSAGDILRPDLLCYKGIQFRLPNRKSHKTSHQQPERVFHEEEAKPEEEEEEGDDEVQELSNGFFKITLNIPSVFFKYLIGKEGKTRSMIEKDTKSSLKIPRRGELGPVVVQAATRKHLIAAKKRIEVITWSNRSREPATHFIGIPLNTDVIQNGLEKFRKQVLYECPDTDGMSEALFQSPAKLHLTLVMIRIFNQEEEKRAIKEIHECLSDLRKELGSLQFSIKLSGIECMNDDPSVVDVLYAQVKETDGTTRLQEFVDALASRLSERAPDIFESRPGSSVKLHATMMNSKFREGRGQGPHPRNRQQKKLSFDASRIFQLFKKFEFGEHTITNLQLSERGNYGDDGFYKCLENFDL